MKKLMMAAVLLTQSFAYADRIHWQSDDKKIAYKTVATGIIAVFAGSLTKKVHFVRGSNLHSAGIITASLGVISVGISAAHDILSEPAHAEIVAAEQKALVRHAQAVHDNKTTGINNNFDFMLQGLSSKAATDEDKKLILAKLILKADALAERTLIGGNISEENQQMITQEIQNELLIADLANENNLELASKIIAISLVKQSLKQRADEARQ